MKRCNQCGAQVPDNARFCGQCGQMLDEVAVEAVQSEPGNPDVEHVKPVGKLASVDDHAHHSGVQPEAVKPPVLAETPPKTKAGSKKGVWMALAALLTIGMIAGLGYWQNTGNGETNDMSGIADTATMPVEPVETEVAEVGVAEASDDVCEANSAVAEVETASLDEKLTAEERKVVGKHLLSLQWISWDYFGSCEISKVGQNRYRCVGRQDSKENSDYLKLDGYISIVNEKHLKFTGAIRTKVEFLNNGEEYVREGTFDFKATDGRQYWREQEMAGPDGVTDYVDIYFK